MKDAVNQVKSLSSGLRVSAVQSKEIQVAGMADDLSSLGGGAPRLVQTPKGATQFIFPNGMILRFDLYPGQYLKGQQPHINLEGSWGNKYINLR